MNAEVSVENAHSTMPSTIPQSNTSTTIGTYETMNVVSSDASSLTNSTKSISNATAVAGKETKVGGQPKKQPRANGTKRTKSPKRKQSTMPKVKLTGEARHQPVRRSKRARTNRETAWDALSTDTEAQELKIALELSMKQKSRAAYADLPEAPAFYPTVEEFAQPLQYISKIKPEAEKYGICKIVPPKGWNPPCGLDKETCQKRFPTRLQRLHRLQEGEAFPDGKSYTLAEYKMMADVFQQRSFPSLSVSPGNVAVAKRNLVDAGAPSSRLAEMSEDQIIAAEIERQYWDAVDTGRKISVEYGNDQDTVDYGSGFVKRKEIVAYQQDKLMHNRVVRSRYGGKTGSNEHTDYAVIGNTDRNSVALNALAQGLSPNVPCDFSSPQFYRRTGWNLNNLPHLQGSLLRYVSDEVAGINVPWLYCGMLFATFAWHVEDNYLYSINYMHFGSSKQWYGVPGTAAEKFEESFRQNLYRQFQDHPDLLSHLTVMMSPYVLAQSDVPAYRLTQRQGEYVVTFPRAYHSGFSHGFNVAEACNFALADWIPWGRMAIDIYHKTRTPRSSVFSHEKLILELAKDCEKLDTRTCDFVYNELKNIITLEHQHRMRLEREGYDSSCRFYVRNDADKRLDCARCKAPCYLSAILCRGCGAKGEMACCRHARGLCQCPPGLDGKVLLYWHKFEDMETLADKVHAQLHALKSETPTKNEFQKVSPMLQTGATTPNISMSDSPMSTSVIQAPVSVAAA